jgi:phage baseplate assembly protein W
LLARLRANGFAIWPFDAPGARTVVEIYPSRLRQLIHAPAEPRVYTTEHERDAAESARVMWEHRASFATLSAATDPVTLIEGDVWRGPLR